MSLELGKSDNENKKKSKKKTSFLYIYMYIYIYIFIYNAYLKYVFKKIPTFKLLFKRYLKD